MNNEQLIQLEQISDKDINTLLKIYEKCSSSELKYIADGKYLTPDSSSHDIDDVMDSWDMNNYVENYLDCYSVNELDDYLETALSKSKYDALFSSKVVNVVAKSVIDELKIDTLKKIYDKCSLAELDEILNNIK